MSVVRLRSSVWLPILIGLAATLAPRVSAGSEVIGYEISVAQVEAGRIRHLAERLAKQNLLYQLHLGEVRKSDLLETSSRIDRVIETLELGSPGYAVPAPWTPALSAQVKKVDQTWGPLRAIAVANPYDYLRTTRQFAGVGDSVKDPLVIRYFDRLAADLIAETENLMALYDEECRKSGASPVLCVTASISGYSAMLSERATKQAVYIVAGIDVGENRKALAETIEAYDRTRQAVNESPFFEAAMSEDRGQAGAFAMTLLESLRGDWDGMRKEFAILNAGDEKNFDLAHLLELHDEMIRRLERFTAAMVRYANIAYAD
jgi:Type IV pili methyl-accepting chemotaxis transducer N-term